MSRHVKRSARRIAQNRRAHARGRRDWSHARAGRWARRAVARALAARIIHEHRAALDWLATR